MEATTLFFIASLTFAAGLLFTRLVFDPVLFGLVLQLEYHSLTESEQEHTLINVKTIGFVSVIIALATWAIVAETSLLIPALLIAGVIAGGIWSAISNQETAQQDDF